MNEHERTQGVTNLVFGWLGTVFLLAILAVKGARFLGLVPRGLVLDVAPSVLGPAGFLFLLLSSTGRLSRLSLLQLTLIVGGLSMGLEFAQLLPRPGILSRVRYTFDLMDLVATMVSLVLAYLIALVILRGSRPFRRSA